MMIDKFIELIESRVDDEEKKEGLIGFAKDAKEDPRKEEALEKFMEQYRHEDGTYDPLMFEVEPYELFDFFNDMFNGEE